MFLNSKNTCLIKKFIYKWHILTNFLCKVYQSTIKKRIMILKDFFEDFSRKLQEYSKNIFSNVVAKAIWKQVGVVHVIPFALNDINF